MIICSKAVELSPAQKLVIVPLSDVHHNTSGFDRDKWLETIAWIEESARRPDRVVLVLPMGDYLDTFSATERKGLASAHLHDTSRRRLEKMMKADADAFLKDIKPIAHLMGSVIGGNHTFKFQEFGSGSLVGKTVDNYIAEQLGVPFLGMCGVLVLEIHRPGSTGVFPFKILMHHGFGSASKKSTSIQQVISLKERFPSMNLYIMGHNHIPIATVMPGIDVRKNTRNGGQWRMVEMPQGFVRGGSFLKGYIEGEAVDGFGGSYVEEACYVPAGLGVATANLRWRRENGEYSGFNIHVQE